MASNNRGPRGQKRANKVKARKKKLPAGRRFGPQNLDALLDAYTDSLEASEFDSEDAIQISALVMGVLDILEVRPRFSATAWTPDDVHYLLDDIEELAEPDLADPSVAAAISFLNFLADSGRWTGSGDNFEHCLEDLKRFLYDDGFAPTIERPDVDPGDELAALTALPVISQFDEILASVGTPVMGTQIPDLDPDAKRLWDSAVDAGLLETASARAYRGPAADSFAGRELAAVRAAAAAFVGRSFVDYEGPGEELVNLATRITFELVLTAMTDEPPVRPDNTGVEFEDLALNVVRARLDIFVEEKWLEFDDVYRVPLLLRPAVIDGLDEYDRGLSQTGPRFTLTVVVDGSDPPQWRRLVVDSAMYLDAFHHVLQAAFGGKHSPSHQFSSPPLPEAEDEPFEPDEDLETSVAIEGMVGAVGDTMTYVGDGGAYTITLDAIDEIDESLPPAQCLDGGPDGVDLTAVQHLFDD